MNKNTTQIISSRKLLKLAGGALFVLFAVSFFSPQFTRPLSDVQNAPNNTAIVSTLRISVGGSVFSVEVVDTPDLRSKGLSGHAPLKKDEGMLFVFENTEKHSFWMKDMLFAIDIIWIGEQNSVVYVQENAQPDSFPASFTPDKPARYVLEVAAGTVARLGIKIGDAFDIK